MFLYLFGFCCFFVWLAQSLRYVEPSLGNDNTVFAQGNGLIGHRVDL